MAPQEGLRAEQPRDDPGPSDDFGSSLRAHDYNGGSSTAHPLDAADSGKLPSLLPVNRLPAFTVAGTCGFCQALTAAAAPSVACIRSVIGCWLLQVLQSSPRGPHQRSSSSSRWWYLLTRAAWMSTKSPWCAAWRFSPDASFSPASVQLPGASVRMPASVQLQSSCLALQSRCQLQSSFSPAAWRFSPDGRCQQPRGLGHHSLRMAQCTPSWLCQISAAILLALYVIPAVNPSAQPLPPPPVEACTG